MVSNIQVLRCFAALAVVWHHLQTRLHLDLGAPAMGFAGRAGVDVFFVISGFIMFHTTRNGDRTVSQFWTDRVIRIAPMYWLATWAVIVLFWLGLQPIGVRAINGGDIVTDMLFLPNYRADGDPYPILDVGWTLNYEMYFYALFGLTFFLRSQVLALAALTGWFVLTALVHMFGPELPHALDFYFEPITLEFAAGGLLALLYRREDPVARAAARYLGFALLAAGIVMMLSSALIWGEYVNWNATLRTLAFGGPAVVIVAGALLLERSGVVWRSPTLLLLGAASYSIYLTHQLALQYTIAPIAALYPSPDAAGFIVIGIAAFTLATIAGVALHLWIEKPVTAWLHGIVRRRRARQAAIAPAA
jgi:exopolysaccharide production protein ExoZ